MKSAYLNGLLVAVLAGISCQQTPRAVPEGVTLAYFEAGPKLVKIGLAKPADADSLLAQGMDLIVIEPDYVIARLNTQDAQQVSAMSMQMETFDEKELVQRLVKVVMNERADLAELGSTGIDIWEVRGDTVIAQAYDKYIRQIEQQGYRLEIIEKDIRNLVQK